jgi:hypothetical protein
MKVTTPKTRSKGKANYSITTTLSHTRESLRMGCPTEKALQQQRMELNSQLNGLMGLMLDSFDLI